MVTASPYHHHHHTSCKNLPVSKTLYHLVAPNRFSSNLPRKMPSQDRHRFLTKQKRRTGKVRRRLGAHGAPEVEVQGALPQSGGLRLKRRSLRWTAASGAVRKATSTWFHGAEVHSSWPNSSFWPCLFLFI